MQWRHTAISVGRPNGKWSASDLQKAHDAVPTQPQTKISHAVLKHNPIKKMYVEMIYTQRNEKLVFNILKHGTIVKGHLHKLFSFIIGAHLYYPQVQEEKDIIMWN